MATDTSVRLTVDIQDTEALLGAILFNFREGHRVNFLVPSGEASATMARVRTKLSRVRKNMKQKGKPHEYFLMQSHIFKWTELDGSRWDCIVLWKKKTPQHQMAERFEQSFGISQL